jgi:outer membrane receptor for ferric coprogen and ferric-rhodotorulic acid
MNRLTIRPFVALLSLLSVGAGMVRAQAAPGSTTASSSKETEDDTVVLSPFVVSAEEDSGYLATATLAGSRVRTDLKDLASSLSVVTKQFMNDIGAVNNTSLLTYTTNTEVGGLYGNFAGVGNTYINGAAETATNLLRPQTNTRVRGLDSADNTRDFFGTDIPWDGFNIGRVDMQRGPNSILFGIGSPAGIINTSVNTAGFKTEGNVQTRTGSFGGLRNSIDLNYVLIPKQLSVRFSGVIDNAKYRQKPAYNHDRRLFTALRWDPQLFGKDSSIHTSIRGNYEKGKIDANRPRSLPPIDRLTPFFDKDKINKQFFDASIADSTGQLPYRTSLGAPTNYWIGGGRGIGEWYNPVLYYNNTSSPVDARQGRPTSEFAIKSDGSSGGGIAWGNGTFPIGISGYNAHAVSLDQYGPANGQPADVLAKVAGASAGFYKDKQITDPNIFDFYRILLDGNTKKEWQGWEAYDISFEQTFLHDRIGYQAVYDRQTYYDGNVSNLGWSPSLSVDIMQNNIMYPGQIPELAVANPNAGRVYTSGRGAGGNRFTFRENFRFTAYGELRAKDFLSEGLLSSILGHHMITGLYSTEKYQTEDRSWDRYSITPVWTNLLGFNNVNHPGSGVGALEQITYLTNSVVGFASASQLHVQGIAGEQTVPETLSVSYFDSHWNKPKNPSDPGYVDPAASWLNPVGSTPSESTQSQNPANYAGWKYVTIPILNADRGDLNDLYRSGAKSQKKTISKGATWQAYLWDDTIVATVGWRTDTVRQRAGFPDSTITQSTGIAPMNYGLAPQQANGVAKGDNVSWGVVVHTPKKLREHLPWGTDISLGYNNSNNIRVENRYGFDGDVLPNAKGHSQDISLVINTLNDRLTFKVAHYKTTVKDANISSVTSEASTLGNNTYILRMVEAQGTGSAMMDLAGIQGHFPNWEWYWNWAEIAGEPGTGAHAWDNEYWNPVGSPEAQARFFAHPETIKEIAAIKAWQDTMQPQSFFDALGYDIDVAKVKAGDWAHAINHGEWQPASYLGAINTAGAGRINGVYPTGTVDNESKGWEFELTGRPLKNWDVSFNASKQFASQTALGTRFSGFIERLEEKFKGPAGDLRVWWGGDNTFRQMFNQNIWAAYQFQKQTNGKLVGEMAPWRFNLVNNYHFDHGLLKGANVGFGYRWQDGTIQGYGLNATKDNLDINKPYWSKSEDYLDLWAGYERKITTKINWRLQLNLGSVGTKPRLIPYNVQPDGTPGQYRIQEGMTWAVTNTFSF